MLDRLSAARIELLWLESLSLESGLIEVDRMIHRGESLQSKDPSLQSRTGSRDAGGIGPEAFDQYAEHLHQMRHHFMASLQDHAADGQWEQVAASHALEGLFDRRLALLKRAQQT
jgi:hypothetical protein